MAARVPGRRVGKAIRRKRFLSRRLARRVPKEKGEWVSRRWALVF